MHTRITELLGTEIPLLLGPMRLITLGEMAATVSSCGGFGQIAASGLSGQRLRSEVEKALQMTNRPFGINIPLYRENAEEALGIAIQYGIKVITTSAGHPGKFMKKIKAAGMKVLHKISTVAMGKTAEEAGVDGVIATGFEAGGHVGRDAVTTFCLLPQLADALAVPVIAAGGIADARGLVAAFALGAEGAELGTRFVATHECPTPDFFKEGIVHAPCNGTVMLGKEAMPIRVLRNPAADSIRRLDIKREDQRLDTQGDRQYVQSATDASHALMPAGQIAGAIHEITTVRGIFLKIMGDVNAVLAKINERAGKGVPK